MKICFVSIERKENLISSLNGEIPTDDFEYFDSEYWPDNWDKEMIFNQNDLKDILTDLFTHDFDNFINHNSICDHISHNSEDEPVITKENFCSLIRELYQTLKYIYKSESVFVKIM